MINLAIAYNFNDQDWHGGRNYFASLFRAIESVADGRIRLHLVIGHNTKTSLPEEFPSVEVLRTKLMDRLHPIWLLRQLGLRAFDTDPLLARYLSEQGIDVLSHSSQLGRQNQVKTIPWLYDFQFMHLPELWQKRHIRWAEQRYRAACRNGDAVIVSSSQALEDLHRFAPWCAKPKFVLRFISNPVDFSKLPSKQTIAATYDLPSDFFYLPNQFWANKNHRVVIDALVSLRARNIKTTIVCTGQTVDGRQPKYFSHLMEYLAASGQRDRFRVLGVVPYQHAQALLAHCRAMINPSLFEGWSTTVEEAKTLHKTMLLSDIPVHREQCSSRASFFSPHNADQLADLIEATLQQPPGSINPKRISTDYATRLAEFGQSYLEILDSVTPIS